MSAGHHIYKARLLGLTLLSLAMSQPAHAGAWTLPEGDMALFMNTFYYSTDESFDANGNENTSNKFSKIELNPYFEYGYSDELTLGISTFLQSISQETGNSNGELTNVGLAETEVFARYKIYEGQGAAVSVQPLLKLPSLYQNEQPKAGRDDMDMELAVLGGYGFKWMGQNHYISSKLAYRHRLGELDDQYKLELGVGIRLKEDWIILPELYHTAPATNSNPNGFSISGQNDYTLTKLQISTIYDWNQDYSIQLGAFGHVAGEDTGAGGGMLFSVWRRW